MMTAISRAPRLRFWPALIVVGLAGLVALAIWAAPTRLVFRCPPRGSGEYYACVGRYVHIWEPAWWTGQY